MHEAMAHQAELRRLAEEAAERWPDIVLDGARVVMAFQDKLAAEPEGTPATAFHHLDLYLALGCIDGNPRAWRLFEEIHLRAIDRYVARVDRAPAFASEVRQRLAERLLPSAADPPRLSLYSGRGPLGSWVRVAAIRVARDLKRSSRAPGEDDGETSLASPTADAEMELVKRELAHLFQSAFREVLSTLSTPERNVLRLHYLDGLTIDEVGKVYGVSRATAARSLRSARHTILQRVRQALTGRVDSSIGSPSDVFAFVRSQLDLSLRKFLI